MSKQNKREIKPVEDSKDKQNTYRVMLGKYKRAMREEFYYEGLLITYAMLEDRLKSFLYYTGCITTRNEIKITKRPDVYYRIKEIVNSVPEYKNEKNLGITTISGKIKIIKSIMIWYSEVFDIKDRYLLELKKQIECIDIGGTLDVLKELGKWLKYRNEVMHALLNKNVDSATERIEDKVQEGMQMARFLDEQVRQLKKHNSIRKAMKLPVE